MRHGTPPINVPNWYKAPPFPLSCLLHNWISNKEAVDMPQVGQGEARKRKSIHLALLIGNNSNRRFGGGEKEGGGGNNLCLIVQRGVIAISSPPTLSASSP